VGVKRHYLRQEQALMRKPGRENIYLNGAILGMTKKEIQAGQMKSFALLIRL
jgi:ABC-type polysaccharide/polyol phosphate transport system ATPase subunit